jgi:hypothetical protein
MGKRMSLPAWVSPDLTNAFFAAERQVSPRLEAALRTDAAMDVLAVSHALRRLLGGAVTGATNPVVETLGLPSRRQIRQLQQSIDELRRSDR